MARTGPGIYELPPIYEAIPGETVLAEQHNTPLEDIAQDLNTPRPIIAGGTGGDSPQAALDNIFDSGAYIRDTKLIVADSDNLTRKVRFDAGNITAGQTRVLTMTDSNLDLANLPRVDAAQSFSQSQINQLLSNAGVQIRQIDIQGDTSSRSATTTTSYGAAVGPAKAVTPKSSTSKLLVLATAYGSVTRTSGGLFGSCMIQWTNGSTWSASSGAYTTNNLGQNSSGTTTTNVMGAVSCMALLGNSDKNAGNWNFCLRGHVSTTGSTPVFEVTKCWYIAFEVEGM